MCILGPQILQGLVEPRVDLLGREPVDHLRLPVSESDLLSRRRFVQRPFPVSLILRPVSRNGDPRLLERSPDFGVCVVRHDRRGNLLQRHRPFELRFEIGGRIVVPDGIDHLFEPSDILVREVDAVFPFDEGFRILFPGRLGQPVQTVILKTLRSRLQLFAQLEEHLSPPVVEGIHLGLVRGQFLLLLSDLLQLSQCPQ